MSQFTNNLHTKDVKEFTYEDAVELAHLIERQEQALSLMKDKLKAYVKLNGDITTTEKRWGFIPATAWVFEKERLPELAALIQMEGKNPFQFFSLSKTNVENMMKAGFTREFLEQFGKEVDANPTFKSVKKQQ